MTGQPLILSKSSMEVYGTCKRQWLYCYVYRIPGAPNLDMAVGTAVHAGAEAHWKGADPVEATTAALAHETALIPGLTVDEFQQAVTDAQAMTQTYLAHIVPTFPVPPTIIEQDFLISVDGVLVSGRIDVADGDVHDTKTTSTPSKVTAERHSLGMTIYRHGYRVLTGKFPGRLVLDVVAKNGRWKVLEVEPDDQGMAEVVGLVAKGINAGDFAPTGAARGACYSCPFQAICSYAKLD